MSTNRRKRVRINKPSSHQQLLSKMFNLSHNEIQTKIIPKAKQLLANGIHSDIDMACLQVCRTNKIFAEWRN